MQHHTHPPRPPHMRPHHMHPQAAPPQMQVAGASAPPPHMSMNLGPPPPQHPQQQAQQQQAHHLGNGPPMALPPASGAQQPPQQQPKAGYMPQQQHMRDPHNRLSHIHQQQQQQPPHHLMPTQQQQMQRIHSTTQMQKIRQQHQLVNSGNGANHHAQQQHMAMQQPQPPLPRNMHLSSHHVPHIKPHPHQQVPPQPQQILPTSPGGLHQQPHCYPGSGNNVKYNHPAGPVAPKSILQNPNRSAKLKPPSAVEPSEMPPAVPTTVLPKTSGTPSESSSSLGGSAKVAAKTGPSSSSASDTPSEVVDASKAESQADKENTPSTTTANDCDELPSDNVISCGESSSNGSKEKTPMCLVNELARFNKITHQYRLTSEKGPAHSKRFTVTLKLGDEEYSAEGFKIKKAQHLAAAEAIEKTKYKHPVPKIVRRSEDSNSRSTITPTVELNALAMKLGQQTYYIYDPRQQAPPDAMMGPPPDMLFGGMPPPPPHVPPPHGPPIMPSMDELRRLAKASFPHPRYGRPGYPPHQMKFHAHQRYPLMPTALGHNIGRLPPHHPPPSHQPLAAPCKITLLVGRQKFVGIGRTLQAAKHDAASRALQVLKTQAANKLNEILNRSIEEGDNKSPISLVYEIGIKHDMSVHFKVLREEGPAHMKNFITACIVGNIVTEGEGNGKKISKKRAAEKMLEELKKLPPLSPSKSPVKRMKMKAPTRPKATPTPAGKSVDRKKRPGGASIKERSESDIAESDNPISKLIVLMQGRKEKDPVYELISKNANESTRRREIIMEVSACGMVARGSGTSKKLAKRNAAQNLLDTMIESGQFVGSVSGPDQTEENSTVEAVGSNQPESHEIALKAAAVSSDVDVEPLAVPLGNTIAAQVPGILILRQNKKNSAAKKVVASAPTIIAESETDVATTSAPTVAVSTAPPSQAQTQDAKNDTQNGGSSSSSNSSNNNNNNSTLNTSTSSSSSSSSVSLGKKKQLLYLAELLGFEVDFSDYPKGNHNEFLTIVTLSTTPAQICHGTGANSEESQNDAAQNALKILSDLGLNNVKSK